MNRPDLDAIESEIRSGYWHLLESEWALLLIAYARHLEAKVEQRNEHISQLMDRISELEAALEPYVTHAPVAKALAGAYGSTLHFRFEPAVADAIRYGLKVADTKRRGNQTPAEWEREPGGYQYRLTYSVDYPPGHPKA